MKFRSVLIFTSLATVGGLMAAAPLAGHGSVLEKPAKPLPELVKDLANENYQTREEATRKLWAAGEAALPVLLKAAAGNDPEQTFRARELIRKIHLSITPETDPEVIKLIERYAKSTPNEKMNLLNLMMKKRAWRQVLKLYATDKNPEVRLRFQEAAKQVAILGARQCLLSDDVDGAKTYLEMAPADAEGLVTLAEFHRSQGTLVAELKQASAGNGKNSDAWKLALYRAAGDLVAAKEAARAANEPRVGASMAVLLGDPLPWLKTDPGNATDGNARKIYTALAIKRWQGKALRSVDLEPLVHGASNRNPNEGLRAINALFLLGETTLAEQALQKASAFGAFQYLESQERVVEALAALGLDPDKPDYTKWVATRMEHLAKDDAEDERDAPEESDQLVTMANFLERRGLNAEADAAYQRPLLELAKKNVGLFTDFFKSLVGSQDSLTGAPMLAQRIGVLWAGDDQGLWADLVNAAFGEEERVKTWWAWLPELDPKADRPERFRAMFALLDIGPDPDRLRDKWMSLAWDKIKTTPVERRPELIARIAFIASQVSPKGGNAAQGLKAWDALPENGRSDLYWGGHILDLSAAGRWDEIAQIFLKQVDSITGQKQNPRPDTYAYVAACLRASGKDKEAIPYDVWADKLALGNTESCIQIGNAYAFGLDYPRAEEWWNRAIRDCNPDSVEYPMAIQLISDSLFDTGKWAQAGAVSEVLAQAYASSDYASLPPVGLLRERMQSDLGRALENLKNDRAASIKMLEKCHTMFPGDGSLADSFFPSLRKAGLMQEHDKWFAISWDFMTDVLKRYPGSENTYNTAGWLAARARMKLDQADGYSKKALAMNPEQPAYLDTMAEIQFAKGDRKKALEWSQLAENFAPQDTQIRRQHERFRTSPLPQ